MLQLFSSLFLWGIKFSSPIKIGNPCVSITHNFIPTESNSLFLRPGCNGTIEITEATRIVDRICSRSVDNSQPRFQYNLTANPVRLKYFTLRGQMQSTPDIGFWLSYRHVKGTSTKYFKRQLIWDHPGKIGKKVKCWRWKIY